MSTTNPIFDEALWYGRYIELVDGVCEPTSHQGQDIVGLAGGCIILCFQRSLEPSSGMKCWHMTMSTGDAPFPSIFQLFLFLAWSASRPSSCFPAPERTFTVNHWVQWFTENPQIFQYTCALGIHHGLLENLPFTDPTLVRPPNESEVGAWITPTYSNFTMVCSTSNYDILLNGLV